jgi:hypothetical protein
METVLNAHLLAVNAIKEFVFLVEQDFIFLGQFVPNALLDALLALLLTGVIAVNLITNYQMENALRDS